MVFQERKKNITTNQELLYFIAAISCLDKIPKGFCDCVKNIRTVAVQPINKTENVLRTVQVYKIIGEKWQNEIRILSYGILTDTYS